MSQAYDCIGYSLEPEVANLVGMKVKPFPNCSCAWCYEASWENQPYSYAPACKCSTCRDHLVLRMPAHFLRVCSKHGHRWTVNFMEPDDCEDCHGVLPDVPAFDDRAQDYPGAGVFA